MAIGEKIKAFFQSTAFPGALMLLVIFLLQLVQPTSLASLGNQVFDSYARADPRPYTPVPVKIVDIDEESLRRQGQWPWPRTEMARLLQRLTDAGASTIALDIVFSEPDRTSPNQLAANLERDGAPQGVIETLRTIPDNLIDHRNKNSHAEIFERPCMAIAAQFHPDPLHACISR